MVIHTIEQTTAYELVIELLAHQFAFPVQWIETQDVFLRRIRRLVELGPARTLLGMTQKTIHHEAYNQIELLASTQDLQQLCYFYDEAEDMTINELVETPESSISADRAPGRQLESVQTVQAAQLVQDAPLTAITIIQALIARKLRKPAADIDTSQTIKDLCGGKSTLQNELVGELSNEFTMLPDRPEDISLANLDATLGQVLLGKTSSALLQRMFTAKMPARMTVATIRMHLATVWGLPENRQTAVLLAALATEPQTRLSSLEVANQYWDGLTEAYSQSAGLSLHRQTAQALHQSQKTRDEDESSIALRGSSATTSLAQMQYQALHRYLRIPASAAVADDLETELQHKLDSLTAEFSDDFLQRIAPIFDSQKTRQYSDWWNEARQELLASCVLRTEAAFSDKMLERLCRRANPNLIQVAKANMFSQTLVPALTSALNVPPMVRLGNSLAMAPQTVITPTGMIEHHEIPRQPATSFAEFFALWTRKNATRGVVNTEGADLTPLMLQSLSQASQYGVTFAGRTYLVTGAGPGSIGGHIVRLLLAGGGCVIVTTSREPSSAAPFFKNMYAEYCSRGSKLYLVPFNQASTVDCKQLIDYIYSELGLDLDAILPFAATGQVGVEIDGLDAKNEVALRLMLVNVLRLLGFVISQKRRCDIRYRPTQVVLPLSPNDGILGGDGLYSESKSGLETLLHRFHSESWGDELSICGVNIGWTRSTSLMTANDMVAQSAEQDGGILTFSADEMADLVVLLLSPPWVVQCEDAPIKADFSGGLAAWRDASTQLAAARASIQQCADISRAVAWEDERESRDRLDSSIPEKSVHTRTSLRLGFPHLPDYDREVQSLTQNITPNLSPEDAVVIVGFSELGPWGSARVRWEMESCGYMSSAGYMEMAWLMNLIRHVDGTGADGYVGWVDVETGNPVTDAEIPQRYGSKIRSNSGIRPLPSDSREILQEILLDEDLPAFETTRANAEALRQRHGTNLLTICPKNSDDPTSICQVQLLRGAAIRVPKSDMSAPAVAGQLPAGWSGEKYGIPPEIAQQVDPVTLVLLCCVAEAFYSAGITDPMEIFEHIHLSELGNFIGSSMGGVKNTRALYHDVYLDQDIASDALQETYLNTAPAWVNMLLLGAAGPIKTPVGACATALESIDSAVESIRAGQTSICLVGGYDDLQPEESAGFERMKATVSVSDEQARGRLPSEMSRPTATSRAGFVESQGCGIQLLCRGDVALAMGLPVYGIVAGSGMAADGISRSVPAPGPGILTFARENSHSPAPLRSSLERWGLGVDDITVVSLHATSTVANDKNEPSVIQREMAHLGRTPGRPLWAVCQKSVTGHPKAPAAAWMLNGCLQILDSGLVPGNRNVDDVDSNLQAFDHLCFPTRSVQTMGVAAFLLNSCGFGQKEAQMVGIHPRYFFALQSRQDFLAYQHRMRQRTGRAERAFVRALMSNQIVRVHERSPYEISEREKVLLNPSARLYSIPDTGLYRVSVIAPPGPPQQQKQYKGAAAAADDMSSHNGRPSTVGVDTVTLSTFTAHESPVFISRNYTDREYKTLHTHRDIREAVASGWCAKEAVFKCLKTVSKGAGAAMKEIEILRSKGAPSVVLHGDALYAAQQAGMSNIELSLSYADDSVIAVALGVR